MSALNDNTLYCHLVDPEDSDNLIVPGTLTVGGVVVGGGLSAQTTATVISKANFDMTAGDSGDVTFTENVDAISTSDDTSLNADNTHIDIVTSGTYAVTLIAFYNPTTGNTGHMDLYVIGASVGSNYGSYPFITGFGDSWVADGTVTGSGSVRRTASATGYLPAGAQLKLHYGNGDASHTQRISQLALAVVRVA